MRLTCTPALALFFCALGVQTLGAQTRPSAQINQLPAGFLRHAYYYQLGLPATGTPPWRWRRVSGTLPPGVALEENGILAGAPTASGRYRFTLQATDSASKPLVQSREYVLVVPPPLTVAWIQPPRVNAPDAVTGELEVTNGSGRELDLTVIVVAVNTFNKAFALGYQHFNLAVGAQRIPFASTLPRDSYVVHADAIGESAETLEIFRTRLQTSPLTVP